MRLIVYTQFMSIEKIYYRRKNLKRGFEEEKV